MSLEFRFGDAGEVTGIYTPACWGSFDGGDKQAPWEGHLRNYAERAMSPDLLSRAALHSIVNFPGRRPASAYP